MTRAPGDPQQQHRFTPKRLDGPRRVKNGLKVSALLEQVRARPDSVAQPAQAAPSQKPKVQNQDFTLARRWLSLLEARLDPSHLQPGLEYARAGQIVNVEISAGLIEAQVQGTAPRPYITKLRAPSLSEKQWVAVIDAMAGEAVYAAKLLANEFPPGMDDLLSSLNLALLPDDHHALAVECTCAAAAIDQPESKSQLNQFSCKHAAAVGYLFAEELANDPLSILKLLGMPAARLVERLRRNRTIQSQAISSAHGELVIPESQLDVPPLEACLEEFWRSPSGDLADLENQPPLQHVPHALLRRLGPSPLNGRFPMVGLLASVYDTVAEAAKRLRDDAEQSE